MATLRLSDAGGVVSVDQQRLKPLQKSRTGI